VTMCQRCVTPCGVSRESFSRERRRCGAFANESTPALLVPHCGCRQPPPQFHS
jgi:hypothetical protein